MAADAIVLGTLNAQFGEQLSGASKNILDSLSFLRKSFENLVGSDSYVWQAAKEDFVENFTKLAIKSST